MDYLKELENMVSEIKLLQKIDTAQLKKLPAGELAAAIKNGKKVIYQITYDEGTRSRKTITANIQLQEQLARRNSIKKELEQLDIYTKVLTAAIERIQRAGVIERLRFLTEKYDFIDRDILYKACVEVPELDEWANASYERSDYMPENLRIVTSRGLRVRSKSEASIAELLYKHNTPFRYEQVLHIGETQVTPDFTIKRKDGKMFYWEHRGLMNNQKYIKQQKYKDELYESVGIVPWDNYIVTYDTKQGDIDLRIVESEIINKLVLL